MQKLTSTVNEQPIKLNFSHYSTILDENINLVELKENISNIFSEKFDSFFSDLYPEKLDGEKEILKTNKEFDEENNSLKISGLEGIELEFKFIDNGGIKTVDFNINVGNTNLSKKQEMYLDTVFGYLEEFGLEFKSSNEFNKNITCSNGVCHFVQVVKEDLTDFKTNLNHDLLKAVLSENGIKIKNLIEQIKDNELKKSLEDFLELSVKSFNNNDTSKEQLDNLKIEITYKIISVNYKRLISSLDSYIKSIESNEESMDEIGNEKLQIGKKVDNIISEKTDELVFLQVKTILEENKKIYLKKLKNLSNDILRQQDTKQNLEASVELGNELPIIIKNIEEEIPLNIKGKSVLDIKVKSVAKKLLKILGINNEVNSGENKEIEEERKKEIKKEIKRKKQEEFKSIKNMIESEYKDKNGNKLVYNYQLFLNNFFILKNEENDFYQYNGINESQNNFLIPFVIEDNKLKINIYKNTKEGIYDVLAIINGQIIVKVNEIDEKYSEIINSNIYKFVLVYDSKNIDTKKELLNTKNNKISNQDLGTLTGEYVDINGERFVKFKYDYTKKYIGLENFYELIISKSHIKSIDTSNFLIINGKKYFNVKLDYDHIILCLEDISFYKHSSFSLEKNHKKSYHIKKIIFDDKIVFKGEEYTKVIRKDESAYKSKEYYINEKGEFLEETIQNKMENNNTLIYEYYYDEKTKNNSLNDDYTTIIEKNNYTYKVNGIKNIIFKKYITVDTEIRTNNWERDDYILYFDGNDFLVEKNSGDLVIKLEEFILDGNIFYKADLIKITDKITTRDNIILNEKFEALNFGDKGITKIGEKSFEYHGKQYKKVYLEDNSEPIFLNLSSKSKYTKKDQFIYKKDGKIFPVYEGKNEGEILKLLVKYNGGKTTVSVSNEIGQKNVGTKFSKNFLKWFS